METLDAEVELRRLASQVELVRELEDDFLERAGLRTTDHLLDVGCGPGFFAERVAREWLTDGRVTGVDVDPSLLELGRERLAGSGLDIELVPGTAVRLPLQDDEADFAYARFLFQHLSEPVEVLKEMARVTRPGGVVAVVDTDDGSLVVHPEPEGFDDLLRASARAQADRGGDRAVGRKLKALMLEAGLLEPGMFVRALTTEVVPPQAFIAMTLSFKAETTGPPFMEEGRAARILEETRRLAGRPDFFAHGLGYGAWGRVP